MTIKYYHVNAFTDTKDGGNPAGVVVDANHLTSSQMQSIAMKLGFSETAFVLDGGFDHDFHVRFFTPTEEVDLCGHATIATFSLLKQLDKLPPQSTFVQKTKAGLLKVVVNEGLVLMDQADPIHVKKNIDQDMLCEMMSLSQNDLGIADLMSEAEIWTTGLEDILLPVKTKEALINLEPNMDKLSDYSHQLDVIGVHAFTIEHDKIWCRNFAPGCGIPEESATGTSNGALGACLKDKGYGEMFSFYAYQGYWMGGKSQIYVQVHDKISVGGKAIVVKASKIEID